MKKIVTELMKYTLQYQYLLGYCYKVNGQYYPVCWNKHWICRKCNYETGRILRLDYDFYSYTHKYTDKNKNEFPNIPIFKKVLCPQCNHYLQDWLLLLDDR